MEPARQRHLKQLRTRLASHEPWLAGPDARGFALALAAARKKIGKYRAHGPVLVAEARTAAYLGGVLAVVEKNLPLVLGNPRWGGGEWSQVAAQIRPGLWLGKKPAGWAATKSAPQFNAKAWPGAIFIPTGGTGGRVRWAAHTWGTLTAAAQALAKFLDVRNCTHVSTLPPWHVSGLMPAVRALETEGLLWLESWKFLEAGVAPKISPEGAIISLVPTQLQRLLRKKDVVRWLQKAKAILVGGAAPTPELLLRARKLRLPIALAYGMTETAAVVAAQRPTEFLAGAAARATPLPHAKVWADKDGRLHLRAASLFQGYYPVRRKPAPFATEDFGVVDAQGRVCPMGRLDRVINTGGEKVHPTDVEKQIRASGLVQDVRVIGLPDAEWGERVVAVYLGKKCPAKIFRAALAGKIAAHAWPKEWIWAKKLPEGKVIA